LKIRGAPAIGIAAAYGVVIGVRESSGDPGDSLEKICAYLASSRPTAVNLFLALDRMMIAGRAALRDGVGRDRLVGILLSEAKAIHAEDREMCDAIGKHALKFFFDGCRVLTHCNAGALATGGAGTALAPMYLAREKGMSFKVYADETRPLLQGARLTAWELSRAGIDVTVICDNMAAYLMRKKMVDFVITGADRIAMNGDAANKIGTYGVAMQARCHGIPFYIAAPSSTFDMKLKTGDKIPIEERGADEVRSFQGVSSAPKRVKVWNPAFDVTPNKLIHAIVTERGVLMPPYTKSIRKMMNHS
jgi:methylthioribose-1-phosphate isomerase